jgi:hypothetical protein
LGRALPFRSNIPKLAEYSFAQIDESYPELAAPSPTGTPVDNVTKDTSFIVRHRLSPRQVKDVPAVGLIPRLAEEEK